MVMLSNCKHTQEQILPRLIESLDRHGYPETQEILQVSQGILFTVTNVMIEEFTVLNV